MLYISDAVGTSGTSGPVENFDISRGDRLSVAVEYATGLTPGLIPDSWKDFLNRVRWQVHFVLIAQ